VRLSVSDIAWDPSEDQNALKELARLGVDGVEIAPTIVWPGWEGANVDNAMRYRHRVADAGLVCSSIQAILFGRRGLSLFGDKSEFQTLQEHMALVADISAALGARVAVFGSPANRRRGELSAETAMQIATERLRAIGDIFAAATSLLCIEPNPPEYGCDFITTAEEAVELARLVDSDGFGVHLDAGALILSGGDLEGSIRQTAPVLEHFHISQPNLLAFDTHDPRHFVLGAALRTVRYKGWRSIELRPPADGLDHLAPAVALARAAYAESNAAVESR